MTPHEDPSPRIEGSPEEKMLIVGVGASAGGLEALEDFFSELPSDSGAAYVVVQHLSPEFKSHMEELLGRHTQMPIHRVVNGMCVEPNNVYLIPPKMEMVISDGRLLITEKGPARKLSHPIDQFFRSLASDAQIYAAGVILSGTGSDGSRGIREIQKAGGIVLVQDLKTAKFDGMPANAQATGVANFVAPPDEIARAIVRYIEGGFQQFTLSRPESNLTATEGVEYIFELLRSHSGLDFSHYKSGTVARRIERRIQLGNHKSLEQYVQTLQSDQGELHELYKDLLIGVTRFFRDRAAFEHLRELVVPKLVDECSEGESLRIWCAGCASGEEAYSIAILFDEYISQHKPSINVKVFATDVHQKSLNLATRGAYSASAVADVNEERLQKYFRKQREEYHVSRDLRKMVLFATQNVISDAPFTQMDMVVCRNLLIYLQPPPQKKVLAMFHFALKTGGVLFLGPSETPGDLSNEFQAVEGRWRIYHKRRDVRLPLDTRVPLLMAGMASEVHGISKIPPVAPIVDQRLLSTYDRLLDRFMPASILVDEDGNLIHCFAGAERYLKMRAGRLTSHVLELIEVSLRLPLSSALKHASNLGERVRLGGIHLTEDSSEEDVGEVVAITVEPVYESSGQVRHFLIVIGVPDNAPECATTRESNGCLLDRPAVDLDERNVDVELVRSLEAELRFTKETLQATIEELETSNEELQATNEELVASNEELQSTNEELHSVNEELYTVNAEHQRRVEELAEANEDMDNLLAATRVGVIFLDSDLYIRRFTPEIGRVFHLVNQDVGRSIRSFAHDLRFPTLVEHLEEVLRTKEAYEREVTDRQGRTFIARMNAYTSERHHGGVVLTLIEITKAKNLEAEAKRLASVIDISPDFVAMLNDRQEVIYLNNAARDMFEIPTNSELSQYSLSDFLTTQSTSQIFHNGVPEALKSGLWSGEAELELPSGKIVPVSQLILGHSGGEDQPQYISIVARDLTAIRRSQEILQRSEARFRRIIDNMLGFVGVLDTDGTLLEANYAATAAGGVSRADVIGKKFWDCIWWRDDHAATERLKMAIEKAKKGEVIRYDAEINVANGTRMAIDFMLVPVKDESGSVTNLIPSGFDISGRKEAERGLMLRQAAIDSASSGIIITDPTLPDCPITYVNSGFTAVTGYSQEDSIGKNCRFLQGPNSDQDDVLLLREAIAAGEAVRVTLLNYRRNGEPFWNDLQITPVRKENGELTNFVGVQHDVTEQVHAEEQMREAAERIQAVLDSTAEGIYGVDNHGCCTFCNAASLKLLGYANQDEIVGRNIHELIHHEKDDEEVEIKGTLSCECALCDALATGERVNVDTEYLRHADGSLIPVEYWSHPIRRGEKVVGAVVTFVDISRRKQQHEELQQARETADMANKAKSRFLANMSHELRTPVAVVLGFADILLQESTDEQVRKRVTVIKRNSDYLLKLLNDILDLSRVEAGAVKVEESSCDLQLVLQDLHEMMQVRATEVSRPLSFHLPPRMPRTVTTDPARLRQIAVNLIGNAIKFSPRGRVDVCFDMTTLNQENALRIQVRDTGIGMSTDQIGKLFQPFSQASDKIAREFGGTGLGLSICKRLVDSLGGLLQVESSEGKGSTFTATLPADPIGDDVEIQIQQQDQTHLEDSVANDGESLSARVLLADDMRDVRYVAKHFLQKAGCEVTVVENGQQAVDAITAAAESENPFDFAIIDMQMPVMDGTGAIIELRRRGIQIPAIALTADAMKGTRKRVLDAGFDEYLAKPINSAALLHCVKELLQNGHEE